MRSISDQSVRIGAEMSDRIDAAPLTTERRYGFSRIGCAIAVTLIVVAVGVAMALITGIRDAGIILAILLPMFVLIAVLANLFLLWQHRRALRNREIATSDQTDWTTQASAPPETPRSSGSWFRRFSQRGSTRSTPPPGYQSVFGGS